MTGPGPLRDLLQAPAPTPEPQLHLMVTVPAGLEQLLGADSCQGLRVPLSLPWLLPLHRAPQEGQELQLGPAAIPELVLQLPGEKRSPPPPCLPFQVHCKPRIQPITELPRAATA